MKDDQLRDVLKDLKISVDTEQLWSELEQHVPERKRRFLPLFWSGTGVAAIVLIVMSIGHFNNSSTASKANTNTTLNDMSDRNTDHGVSESELAIELVLGQDNNINKSTIINDNTSLNETTRLFSNSKESSISEKIMTPTSSTPFEHGVTKVPNNNPGKATLELIGNSSAVIDQPTHLTLESIDKLSALAISTVESNEHQYLLSSESMFIEVIENQIPRWAYTAFAGVGRASSQYQFQADDSPLKELSELETMLPTIASGMGVSYSINRHWSIGLGLSYTRYTTRLSMLDIDTWTEVQQGVTDIVIDADGNEHRTTGPLTTEYQQAIASRSHSYHSLVSIPLSVRYTHTFNTGYGLYGEAGLRINLLSDHRGSYLSLEDTVMPYAQDDQIYQPSSIGGSIGLGLNVPLGARSTIDIGVRYSLDGITSTLGYDQIFHHILPTLGYTRSFQ